MSANVETMFSVREVPWHGLGTIVQEAPTSKDALHLAGLDWNVVSRPIFTEDGQEIEGYRYNIRDSDNTVLGIVSNKYKIVQNAEAFEFTDALISENVRYETAGSLRNGRQIWLLAKMLQTKIVGDAVDPYICFTNSHDGLGSIRCCMTPVRVVCNNTLSLALENASRSWSTKHVGDISTKLAEARRTLILANDYMNNLAETADKLANTTFTQSKVEEFVSELFKAPDDATDRVKNNVEASKQAFMYCYFAPDIAKFQGTAWGVVNAASDFATHAAPVRKTAKYAENRFSNSLNGNVIIDTTMLAMMKLLNKNVG